MVERYGSYPVITAPPLQRVWATVMAPLYESDSDFKVEAEWKIDQEAPFAAPPVTAEAPELGSPGISIPEEAPPP